MRRVFLTILVAMLLLALSSIGYCADTGNVTDQSKAATPAKKTMSLLNKNFAFILGSISKVEVTGPETAKIEVISDIDKKPQVIEIAANTNVLKGIDVSELKSGDKVRIMARKAGDKEVALSVVTGKIKEMSRPSKNAIPAVPAAKQEKSKK